MQFLKELHYSAEARNKMKEGVDKLANAVKKTLGPRGRNVVIENMYGLPHSTKDGVTVAKSINLKDPVENIGAQMVKEVASKTVDMAGDGTTTATILAQAMLTSGLNAIAEGANPMGLKKGIDMAVTEIVKNLKQQSIATGEDIEKIRNIATISANNDKEIGDLIAEGLKLVGVNGLIKAEEAQDGQTKVRHVKGLNFANGYVDPRFVTDTVKMVCEYKKPRILVYDRKITSIPQIQHIVEASMLQSFPLLIICEDIDGPILQTLVRNKLQAGLQIVAVRTPSFGDMRSELLEDIAIITGGAVLSESSGMSLQNSTLDQLGSCEKLVVERGNTCILGGAGNPNEIAVRIESIRLRIENEQAEYVKDRLRARIATLEGGIAVLEIGGATEVEVKERKDRVEDAICATQSAIKEGIVPGGGIAYLRAISSLGSLNSLEMDVLKGIGIVVEALEEPIKAILENAGISSEEILAKVKSLNEKNFGYNVAIEEYGDMLEMGVIDPTQVPRVALENAASVVTLMLLTECIVINEREIEMKEK